MAGQIIQMTTGGEHNFRSRMEVTQLAMDVIFKKYSIADLQALIQESTIGAYNL